jgi:hypothetical protein
LIFYIATEGNESAYDALREFEILNIETKAELTIEDMIRFMKRELRNLEIKCLIIETKVFDTDITLQEVKEILDIFYILNTDSKVIVHTDREGFDQLRLDYPGQVLVVHNRNIQIEQLITYINSSTEVIDLSEANGQEMEIEDRKVIYSEPTNITSDDLVKPSVESANNNTKVSKKKGMESKKHVTKLQEEDMKSQGRMKIIDQFQQDEVVPAKRTDPEAIYTLAAQPNKLSDGLPLRKRIEKAKEEVLQTTEINEYHNVVDITQYTSGYSEHIATNKLGNWIAENVVIGVIGTERKVGVTTACFKLAFHLHDASAKVSYSEANSHNHLDMLAKEYKFHFVDGHYVFLSIPLFMNSEFDTFAGMNFIILDLGCMTENEQVKMKIIQEAVDHVIIVSGHRLYEQKALLYALSVLPEKERSILFNYVEQEALTHLKSKYKDMVLQVANVPYQPEFDQSGVWSEDFVSWFDKFRKHSIKQNSIKK